MKIYPKMYEDVFSKPFLRNNNMPKCRLDQVSAKTMSLKQYVMELRGVLTNFDLYLFDYLVKIFWLFKQFRYKGKKRQMHKLNGIYLDGAFAFFMRHYVGFDARLITRNVLWMYLTTYFDDFFPSFDELNPFRQKLKYPYKYVSLAYLIVVWKMDERIAILAEAEKQKMEYTYFLDYVMNYISCYNDEYKTEKYIFICNSHFLPYVRKK